MCISNAKEFIMPEMLAWKVFLVKNDRLFSPIYKNLSYEVGKIYNSDGTLGELDENPDKGFHAFFRKHKAKRFARNECSPVVVKRVRLYDVKWKGFYYGNLFRDVVTAERMEILPDN